MKTKYIIKPYHNSARPAYKFKVLFNDGIKDTYRVFTTKSAALAFVESAKEGANNAQIKKCANSPQIKPQNEQPILHISRSSLAKCKAIELICNEYGVTIEEILRFYIKYHTSENKSLLLKQAVKSYLEYLNNTRFSDAYKDITSVFLKRFSSAVGDVKIFNLKDMTVTKWLNSLKVITTIKGGENIITNKPISDITFNNYRSYLLIFFNWCVKQEYIKNNPILKIEKRMIRRGDVEYYSVGQIKEYLEMSKENEWLHLYVALAAFTGIRREELFKLKWSDIYLEDKEIVLSANVTKTKQRRIVKITDNLVKYIEAYKYEKSGLVFNSSAISQRLKRLNKKLSFAPIKNGFRHTAATYYLAKSQNEYETARQLGHSVEMLKLH